ncbi:MAG: hypothetical protein RJB66_1470 [Pseudomonadota bacterium]|jgi:hypothetical protein
MRWGFLLTYFWLLQPVFALVGVDGAGPSPFWRVKPDLYQRVVQNREIFVSVKRLSDNHQWRFSGGGHVKADLQTSWNVARQYEQLARLDWFFRTVSFDKPSSRLALDIRFLGFSRNLLVVIKEQQELPSIRSLSFRVEQGFFKGLRGHLNFSSYSKETTEIGFEGDYSGEVNLASFLFIPGCEAVMSYVAKEMRRIIEEKRAALVH